tara:strand:- start:778 stop:2259 length:1482 start_codon:yes stop_codon:yes gene_type:complete
MKKTILIFLFISGLIGEEIVHPPHLQSRIRLFEAWLETLMDDQSLIGISVGVVHDQKIVYSKGFGYADLDNNILTDESINFKIASITKLFTSIALMQLVEKERIDLNDPVINYVPAFKNIQTNGYDITDITIKSILTHSASLPVNADVFFDNNTVDTLANSTDNLLNGLSKQSLLFKPNRIQKYSNLGMNLGGVIIEKVSGLSYDQYIQRHILEPAKMTTSHFDHSAMENSAVGYSRFTNRVRVGGKYQKMPEIIGLPSAGLVSNIIDLCSFMKWHFNVLNGDDESILSKQTLEEMQTIHRVPLPFELHPVFNGILSSLSDFFDVGGTGLGYFRNKKFTMHGGGLNGFGSELIMDNENRIGIIVLSNTDGSPIYLDMDRSITKNLYEIVGKAIIENNSQTVSGDFREYENTFTNHYYHHYYFIELNQKLALINLRDSFPLNNPAILTMLDKDFFVDQNHTGIYAGEFNLFFQRDENDKINSLILGNEKLYLKN